jgi:protease-4
MDTRKIRKNLKKLNNSGLIMAISRQGSMPQPPQFYQPRRKTRWWIPLIIVCIVLLLIVIFFFVLAGLIGSAFQKEPYEVRAYSVLMIEPGENVQDYSAEEGVSPFSSDEGNDFFSIINAINRAKDDSNIEGIYLRIKPSKMGWAMSEEYIEALQDFKQSGKFVYAYTETATELDYMRALPADKIFMPSEGLVEMNGFGATAIFLKGLLQKFGIDFYVKGFEDFKSAGEQLSRKDFSDSARYQLRVLMNERLDRFVSLVSKYRKIKAEKIHLALNNGLYTADSLLEYGFIDSIASETVVKQLMKEKIFGKSDIESTNDKMHLVSVSNYSNASNLASHSKIDKSNQIALIFASGNIVERSSNSPFSGNMDITAKTINSYLQKARQDDKIKAIILRINSPGGSVISSDLIWEEIQRTRKVKPVYASMSNYAASGGYYIAMACDTIIASPTTITGSIGVVSAIPNFSRLLKMLDIGVDTLSTGPSAQDLNVMEPFSDRQLKKLDKLMEGVYFRFIDKVAKARKMTPEQVRSIAKGRVWSGSDALRIGLVDTLGGLKTAFSLAKRRIGLDDSVKIKIKVYPEPKDFFTSIFEALGLGEPKDEEVSSSNIQQTLAKALNVKPDVLSALLEMFPAGLRVEIINALDMYVSTKDENILAVMPFILDVK